MWRASSDCAPVQPAVLDDVIMFPHRHVLWTSAYKTSDGVVVFLVLKCYTVLSFNNAIAI